MGNRRNITTELTQRVQHLRDRHLYPTDVALVVSRFEMRRLMTEFDRLEVIPAFQGYQLVMKPR